MVPEWPPQQQPTVHQVASQDSFDASESSMKRQRRPRHCQNRGYLNGSFVTCGQIDCPGRGGQKHCRTFITANSEESPAAIL
jgi:hypothetical protein